jgi:Na+/pantothenate symporter
MKQQKNPRKVASTIIVASLLIAVFCMGTLLADVFCHQVFPDTCRHGGCGTNPQWKSIDEC